MNKYNITALLIILISTAILITGSENSSGDVNLNAPVQIKLPVPETTGGMPLMDALSGRQSSRNFSTKQIPEQILSNLLWAGFGINRKETGKRTAPTANDTRAIDIYVVLESGVYRYNAEENSLELAAGKDLRSMTGKQDFAGKAPLNLIYVSDYSKMKSGSDKEMYSGAHAGFIGQNVYLYCTSAGLATVIRAYVEREPLAKELNLSPDQKIVLAQTVGYPEK